MFSKEADFFSLAPRIQQPEVKIAVGKNTLESKFFLDICKKSNRRIAIIADQTVAETGYRLKELLSGELFLFEGGEKSKTRETKQFLEDELLKKKFGRDTLILALGGGTSTDLIGFLASTYMRGVPLILIPTTLLAMVDATIGGKTGVNTPFGKNLIGSFYFPKAIIIDTLLLDTLPHLEWMNGLAEIIKVALIFDVKLFEICEKNSTDWEKIISELIKASIQNKIKIVEKDPKETGLRRILNFGHTVGHAIEFASDYTIPHGLAVAVGCQAESYMSHILGYLSESNLKKILNLYQRLLFPRTISSLSQRTQREIVREQAVNDSFNISRKSFLEAMQLDKKGKNHFVMIDQIGSALPFEGKYCRAISSNDLETLADWVAHG